MKFLICSLAICVLSLPALALDEKSTAKEKSSLLGSLVGNYTPNKDQVLGEILKGALENVHFTKKKLDDDLSREAFKSYLEKLDYGKQFLLKSDIEKLAVFKTKFDDQLKYGDLSVIKIATQIMQERITQISKYVATTLSKDFDFKKEETYETDAEKRKFASSVDELKERWRKLIKLETLIEYLDLKDEQDGVNDDEDEKPKKKVIKKITEKKLSQKELMSKARSKVEKRYRKVFRRLQDEKRTKKLDKFYNAITRVYDPHTTYLIPEEKEDFDMRMTGKLDGIGALLSEEGSYIKVVRIIPGSASWKGKELKAEDIILAVAQGKKDFIDIVDMSISDAVKLIRGKKGTVVRLKIKKPDGHVKNISIIRDEVILEETYVKSTILEHKDLKEKIGYIQVPSFYRDFEDSEGRNCSDDVKKELLAFAKKDLQGVILDLRNNGGGALQDATLMSGLFFDKGPVVQVKNSGPADIKSDVDGKTYWNKSLIILVNRFSASASEILAAAMKDYSRALIVGSSIQTHGKGTVQAVLDLKRYLNPFAAKMIGDIGAIKITTDMFYRINGMSTQFRGVKPDIVLPDVYGHIESGERELDYAIPYHEIEPLKYKKWTKTKFDVSELKDKSEDRVKKSKKFKKILDSNDFYSKRKDETERTINLEGMSKFRTEAREYAKKFKIEEINEKIVVSPLAKAKDEADKERQKEFSDTLRKDPVIEETLMIFNDVIIENKKSKS